MRSRVLVPMLAAAILTAIAAPAHAFRLPPRLVPLTSGPVAQLATLPADPETYDTATRCDARPKPGVTRMVAWLQRNARGQLWGTYRCELWGKGSASLHAESRAIDWHLDVFDAADRRGARALIQTLLAPDALGNQHALARRMGVEELIWDCSYWGAGMAQFKNYSECYGRDGKTPKKHVDPTLGHRNHIHIGLSRAGARARTSFWRAR